MVAERKDNTFYTQPVDAGCFYETLYRKIISELYPTGLNPIEPIYGRFCELIGDLDGIEEKMLKGQSLMVDGRPLKDPQRIIDERKERDNALADEIWNLSQMARLPKRKPHLNRHR